SAEGAAIHPPKQGPGHKPRGSEHHRGEGSVGEDGDLVVACEEPLVPGDQDQHEAGGGRGKDQDRRQQHPQPDRQPRPSVPGRRSVGASSPGAGTGGAGQVRGGGRGRLAGVGLGAGIHASTVDRRRGYLPPTGVTTAGGGEHDHRHCTHDRGHGSRSPGAAYGGGVTQPVCDAPLIRRLLPPLQALAVVFLRFATLGALADSGPWSSAGPMVAVLYGSAIPVVALLWVARSRVGTARGRAVLTVLVAIVLIPVAVFGSV